MGLRVCGTASYPGVGWDWGCSALVSASCPPAQPCMGVVLVFELGPVPGAGLRLAGPTGVPELPAVAGQGARAAGGRSVGSAKGAEAP